MVICQYQQLDFRTVKWETLAFYFRHLIALLSSQSKPWTFPFIWIDSQRIKLQTHFSCKAELLALSPQLYSSLAWLRLPSSCFLLLRVISWTFKWIALSSFPLRPSALGANLIFKASLVWLPAIGKLKPVVFEVCVCVILVFIFLTVYLKQRGTSVVLYPTLNLCTAII